MSVCVVVLIGSVTLNAVLLLCTRMMSREIADLLDELEKKERKLEGTNE